MPKRKRADGVVEAKVRQDVLDRIGSRITYLRKGHMTQEELGVKTGLGGSYVSRIENGKEKNPGLSALVRIAAALGSSVSTLVATADSQETTSAAAPISPHPAIEALIERIDAEYPAEPSWRGDILQAIAILNRALRRDGAG